MRPLSYWSWLLRSSARRFYRLLLGTCLLCGSKRSTPNENDVHSRALGHAKQRYCRRCNKTLNHARIYGGNARRFKREIYR